MKSHRSINHVRPNKLYHLYRLPTVSRRASDTWILCLKPMKWKFSRSAPLTMRLHCVFIYTTRHQTPPAECEPEKSSLLLLGFVENKTQQFSKDLCSPFFSFFSVSFSSFSMVLMSASSKAPIKAFPCDGLFALKICRSNPESGHEINPMALSAHYKAFCCVMISPSLSASLAYIIPATNPFLMTTIEKTDLPHNPSIERRAGTFLWQLLENKLQDWQRDGQQKWALSRHP